VTAADAGARLVPMSIRKFIPLRIKADGHKGFDSLMNDIRGSLADYGKYDGPIVHVIIGNAGIR
jgi:hypothetical protein